MITTPDLINVLAGNAPPVRRLRPPVLRAAAWLLLSLAVLALLAFSQGIRPDLAACLSRRDFVFELAGASLTGVLAAIAAFLLSLPDRSRLWILLPAPGLGLWLSTIGYQCLTDWVSLEPGGMRMGEAVRCFATLVLASLPLSLVMLVMVRDAAPLRPTAVSLVGAIAVAGITSVAMALFHALDASVMILMWNLGTAMLFVAAAGTFARRLFSWVAPRSGLERR